MIGWALGVGHAPQRWQPRQVVTPICPASHTLEPRVTGIRRRFTVCCNHDVFYSCRGWWVEGINALRARQPLQEIKPARLAVKAILFPLRGVSFILLRLCLCIGVLDNF